MITVSKTTVMGKGHNDDQEFLYINLLNFANYDEREEFYFKIKDMVEEYNNA